MTISASLPHLRPHRVAAVRSASAASIAAIRASGFRNVLQPGGFAFGEPPREQVTRSGHHFPLVEVGDFLCDGVG
jgi:hypothetical protein